MSIAIHTRSRFKYIIGVVGIIVGLVFLPCWPYT